MSLYSVIVPLKGITNRVQLEIAFKKEIESIVLKNNIGKNKIDLNEILILATNNKSVVGSQVELIRMAKYIYIDCGYFDLENINGTPMSIHKSFPDLEFNKFIKSIKGKEKDF
jgi:hypothetical protein